MQTSQDLSGSVGWCEGILCHRGVLLILAYSWARPAIVEVGKGRGGMFLFLLFLPFHSCSSFFPVPLFHLFYYLFYLFSPFLWETTQNDPQGLTCRSTPTQSIKSFYTCDIIRPRQVKKCLRTRAKYADSDHPACAQSIIRAFVLHSYIP